MGKIVKIPVIIGPTGVGKSSLAIKLAKKLSADILNTDSSLFYKFLDIGTDKPSDNEMKNVDFTDYDWGKWDK